VFVPPNQPSYPPAPQLPAAGGDDVLGLLSQIVRELKLVTSDLARRQLRGILLPITLTIAAGISEQARFGGEKVFGFIVTNDGPGAIDYQVPFGGAAWQTLNATETQSVLVPYPTYEHIGFRNTNAANAATVRILGIL